MAKIEIPVSQIRRHLKPGPIVLVSLALDGARNIMTMGWHTVMEFTPSLVGCVIAGGNHSFLLIPKSREFVINLPDHGTHRHGCRGRKHDRRGDRQV